MIKVGVIGVGHLGRFHAEKYRAMPEVELVGVVDIDRSRAEAIGSTLGVRSFVNHRELFELVDAVSVVVPTRVHYPVARDCLEAGIHVLVEKPMTRTIEEAEALIDLANRKDLVLQVGHLERFNPAWVAAGGLIDRPLFIEADRVSPFPHRGTDVDVVLDLMIHDIDITLHLVKEAPVLVRAVGASVVTPLVDIANARLEFPGGCVANLNASRVSVKTSRKIRIFRRDAYLTIDFGQRQSSLVRPKIPHNGSSPIMEAQDLSVPTYDALEHEIRSFVSAVTTGSQPVVTGQDGCLALTVALEIIEAIKAHQNGWGDETKVGLAAKAFSAHSF